MTFSSFARRLLAVIVVAGGALLGVLRLYAQYGAVDIQEVPVARIIANLEDVVAKSPKDAGARNNLARAHAMAYAKKALTLPVGWRGYPAPLLPNGTKPDPAPGPVWFGYESDHVPFGYVLETHDDQTAQVARAHLSKAIQIYREVIELAPEDYSVKLGYGWCLEQSGEKAQAITVYRAVIASAWSKEKDLRGLGLSRPLTAEAGGYLIALLDPEKDRDEIATLRGRMAQLARLPRAITPIAIPLTNDIRAESLIAPSARVVFDADGGGLAKSWTWITPKAGWLVWSPGHDQPVTSALQMFGSVTFWMFWNNGYDAMRALDDNHDRQLTGAELEGLAIWQDRNSNGIDDEGEVQTLHAWGIVALSCGYDSASANADYAAMSTAGVTFVDGHTVPTYDVLLYERPQSNVISRLERDNSIVPSWL